MNSLFNIQKKFNDIFFNLENLNQKEKEDITRSLCLAAHTEVSELVSGLNFKDHRLQKKDFDLNKVLYESVDAIRYIISILNLWEVSPEKFEEAFLDKDLFLQTRHRITSNAWEGQPVVIVDIDDVLAHFRSGFLEWLEEYHDVHVSPDSREYYTSSEVKKAGLNPEQVFFEFIDQRKIRYLESDDDMIREINKLKDDGFWIQLLTARPKENLVCLYDTYFWLENSNLKYDMLDFSGEKYRWCAQSDYFDQGKIVCAIDDSAKHAAEYAKHNIPVFLPSTSYNQEVHNMENVFVLNNSDTLFDDIKNLFNSV